jgi:hypothetical protein
MPRFKFLILVDALIRFGFIDNRGCGSFVYDPAAAGPRRTARFP